MNKITNVSGSYSLQCARQENGFSLGIYLESLHKRCLYQISDPMRLTVRKLDGDLAWYSAPYTSVQIVGDALIAEGEIETVSGSVYGFKDKLQPHDTSDGFLVEREVTVIRETDDQGFFTRLSFCTTSHNEANAYNFFGPGAWYEQNKLAPEHFMGYDLGLDYHWYMETRFSLPFLTMQNRFTGDTLTLSRSKADVKPLDGSQTARIYHSRAEYSTGSLGFSRPGGMSLDYVFPGTEAGSPVLFNRMAGKRGLTDLLFPAPNIIRRLHPSTKGFVQKYSVIVQCSVHTDFKELMRTSWRHWVKHFNCPIANVDNKTLLDVTMSFLEPFCRSWTDGAWGFPGAWDLPDGDITDISKQFGFVGQQPGMGHMFIRYGTQFGKDEFVEKGKNVINFWVEESMMDWGLPNVWFVIDPPRFRMEHPIWIRMLCDGMENIIDAYQFLKRRGDEHPAWLDFCVQVGDWLVKNINDDGSWYRAYKAVDGSVYNDAKSNTISAVRFLVQLYLVTIDENYQTAARRAGDWSYLHIYENMQYIGGTCDNASILDKEAGIYAIFGFLALYDLDGNEKWLQAAKGAADYTETWMIMWNYPVHLTILPHSYERGDITGQSFIATGHSHIDMYMAACSYVYYRLYLLTGDAHYLETARFCHKNPRQFTDIDGTIGYKYRGMTHEANCIYDQVQYRADSNVLFCNYIQIEPILRFIDTFDVYEIDDAEKLPMEERQKRNRIYDSY